MRGERTTAVVLVAIIACFLALAVFAVTWTL